MPPLSKRIKSANPGRLIKAGCSFRSSFSAAAKIVLPEIERVNRYYTISHSQK
jgi:hypothetical protein